MPANSTDQPRLLSLGGVLARLRRRRPLEILVWTALALVYFGRVLVPQQTVFWSPDEGARFIETVGYTGLTPSSLRLAYGGEALDPEWRFYPRRLERMHPDYDIGLLYPQPTDSGGVETNWSPLFPLLSSISYRLLGTSGLYLLPGLAGILLLVLCSQMAERLEPGSGLLVAATIGFGSPILFYSLLFWEHTLSLALAVAATWIVLGGAPGRGGSHRLSSLILAAALFLAAIVLRREQLLLLAAAAAALAIDWLLERRQGPPARTRLRSVLAPAAAVALAAGSAAAVLFGGGLGEAAEFFWQSGKDLIGSQRFWSSLPRRLEYAWIDLPTSSTAYLPRGLATLGVAGVVASLAAPLLPKRQSAWFLTAGLACVVTPSLWQVAEPERFREIHSLLQPAPYLPLAAAFVVSAGYAGERISRRLGLAAVMLAAGATTIALFGFVGGLEWGNRYLLAIYPILGVCAVVEAGRRIRKGASRDGRAALATVTLLALFVGVLYEIRGGRELHLALTDLRSCAQSIEERALPVVTDLYWLPASLAPTFIERPLFVLPYPTDLPRWLAAMGGRVSEFTVVTGWEANQAPQEWLAAGAGRIRLQRERVVGRLRFIDFILWPREQGSSVESGDRY